jgi:hypothetical protein
MNLQHIFEIHSAQANPITCHVTSSKNLQEFLKNWSHFQKKYSESNDRRVVEMLRTLAYIRTEFLSNPIPYEFNANLLKHAEFYLESSDQISNLFDASDSSTLKSLKEILNSLLASENPLNILSSELEAEFEEDLQYVVLKSNRIRSAVENHFSGVDANLKFIMPGEVPLIDNADSDLIYIGAPENFLNIDKQISAVVSRRIHFVCYGTRYKAFMGVLGQGSLTNYKREIRQITHENEGEILDFHFYSESDISQETLSRALLEDFQKNDLNFSQDLVDSYAYALADNYVIFLPVPGELSKSVSVEAYVPTEPKHNRVQRLDINEVGANTVFLVRQGSTATEALRPIADEILGQKAIEYRRTQLMWKSALRDRIDSKGSETVVRELKTLGIRNPYPSFWANPLRIAPRKETFRILLRYLNLETKVNEIFEAVDAIKVAHIKAGHKFLTILQSAFEEVEPQEIYQNGLLNRRIQGEGDIAILTAIVCLAKLPNIHRVPEEQIRKLIRTDFEV